MSYSAHRRDALNAHQTLAFRASHARSCAVHVAQKFGVLRSKVLAQVLRESGVDLENVESGEAIERALACLDRLRLEGAGPASPF